MRIAHAFLLAAALALPACSPSPSAEFVKALANDTANNCFGGQGYGVGAYGARANDPTVSVKVSPTGCEITHGNGGSTTVIFPPSTNTARPIVVTPDGAVKP